MPSTKHLERRSACSTLPADGLLSAIGLLSGHADLDPTQSACASRRSSESKKLRSPKVEQDLHQKLQQRHDDQEDGEPGGPPFLRIKEIWRNGCIRSVVSMVMSCRNVMNTTLYLHKGLLPELVRQRSSIEQPKE